MVIVSLGEGNGKAVIDGFPELLLAPDVAFRRLHRSVPEKKLDLFKFATGTMTKSATSATKVMRCKVVHADPLCTLSHYSPDDTCRHSKAQFSKTLPNPPECQAVGHS